MATLARAPLSLSLAKNASARLAGPRLARPRLAAPRLGGMVVCLLVLSAGCSSSKAAEKDVTITACKASPGGGHPTAEGRITNHSRKDSAYTIHVKFTDSAGNGAGDGFAAMAKVDAGSSATWHATGTVNSKGSVTCKLDSVTRNGSP